MESVTHSTIFFMKKKREEEYPPDILHFTKLSHIMSFLNFYPSSLSAIRRKQLSL
jgi:hypothetical protein